MDLRARVSIVVLTHNRRERVLDTLEHLLALPERCSVWLVDNASADGTADAVAQRFPQVALLRLARNVGAAARNAGARAARTPYVAFCDDDTWWAPGALARAAALLDRHPRVAVLSARVLVGPEQREDPICAAMARSPLPRAGLPGPQLLGFLAGACVVRRTPFLTAGGYEPRLFLGAEEALLALDLAAQGWAMTYAPQLRVHHHPAPRHDGAARRRRLARNALWIAWMRRPLRCAVHETLGLLRRTGDTREAAAVVLQALPGLPWVLRARRVLPAEVERMREAIDRTAPR